MEMFRFAAVTWWYFNSTWSIFKWYFLNVLSWSVSSWYFFVVSQYFLNVLCSVFCSVYDGAEHICCEFVPKHFKHCTWYHMSHIILLVFWVWWRLAWASLGNLYQVASGMFATSVPGKLQPVCHCWPISQIVHRYKRFIQRNSTCKQIQSKRDPGTVPFWRCLMSWANGSCYEILKPTNEKCRNWFWLRGREQKFRIVPWYPGEFRWRQSNEIISKSWWYW